MQLAHPVAGRAMVPAAAVGGECGLPWGMLV